MSFRVEDQKNIVAQFVNPMPASAAADAGGANGCIGTIQCTVNGANPLDITSRVFVRTTIPTVENNIVPNPKVGDICFVFTEATAGGNDMLMFGIFVYTPLHTTVNSQQTNNGNNHWRRLLML